MRYFVDCEFDGHNGPLLSIALVPEVAGGGIELVATDTAQNVTDPWVHENVMPHLGKSDAPVTIFVPSTEIGGYLRRFIATDHFPIINADSVVDIARLCRALSTGDKGEWVSLPGNISFNVYNVEAYPTDLEGAVPHNAWWDAMALRYKVAGRG